LIPYYLILNKKNEYPEIIPIKPEFGFNPLLEGRAVRRGFSLSYL